MEKKHGFSFSWKRALGVSSAKQRVSRRTRIPMTRSGRQRKVGRTLGCCIPLVGAAVAMIALGVLAIRFLVT